jgi:transcriptional regulator of acetoin/glycerol metabolism
MKKQDRKIIIKRSHDRSKSFGIEPDRRYPKHVLKESELDAHLEKKKELIEISRPVINQLLETIEKTEFIIVLTDEDGCILIIQGGEKTLAAAHHLNMKEGAYMSEQSIGTNSMGTALKEDAAVQITAKEHFISVYHQWTCSAAPIHHQGEIIGTLNLTGKAQKVHPHTLGLVVAGVDAIENKLINNQIQQELHASNQYAWAMMNNLSYGVFAIDLNEEIQWVNDSACRILNIRRKQLLGTPIESLLSDWRRIRRIVIHELNFQDQESKFNLESLQKRFLFNAYLIKDENNEILGYLLSFRTLSRMLNLVKKYSGLHANHTFKDIVAVSSQSLKLVQYAKSIANSPSTVLITGASGTGKEIFAQALHNESERRNAAFVAVNCGAIPHNLIESELFGYEEGAFTGARKGGRPGKFELADQGTLFLDEIGEMPVDMQVKLLRVLQEDAITRVGGHKSTRVDVRIIAATNKNLEEEIKQHKFRLDLYYRLNVLPMKIPSLRERPDDIMPLLRHFMALKADKLDKPIPGLTQQLTDTILNYHWPGNIRELENYAEKLVNLNGDPSMLESPITETSPAHSAQSSTTSQPPSSIKPLEEMEKEAIIHAMELLKGNVSQVARHLHIGRNTLYEKLKKYQLNPKDFHNNS